MLLHYIGKLKLHIFCRYWRESEQIAFFIACTFVIHLQILIFSVFKIANLSPYWLQIKFSMSLFFYLFTLAINLWHRKFVTEDVTAVFVNNQHDIKRWWQDFDKKFCISRGTQRRDWQTNFLRKAGQSVVLINCSESCRTQAQLTGGQAVADRAVPALKKTLSFFKSCRSLQLTFCRLSGEVNENTFLSVKKTKSVAYCGNFWSRSLAMRAGQFASVSSCARRLLKHFRRKSLQIIWDTDDRCIPVSHDISRTVLWICGLSSWLRTKSLTVCLNVFLSAGTTC